MNITLPHAYKQRSFLGTFLCPHTSVPCSTYHSSFGVYTSWLPTAWPPHLDPWWQTRHSLPARLWRHDTLLFWAARGWSATAGFVWTQGLIRVCKPILERQTLRKRDKESKGFVWVTLNKDVERKCHSYRIKQIHIFLWVMWTQMGLWSKAREKI